MHIKNPVEWVFNRIDVIAGLSRDEPADYWVAPGGGVPSVRRISVADLRLALVAGLGDFAAGRTDVAFLCLIYPVVGLVMAGFAARDALLPMLFPLAAGFVLVGPLAAVGLYEISRRREITGRANWLDVFRVLQSPAIFSIVGLGMILVALFLAWLFAAQAIYDVTLGPLPPVSVAAFVGALFTTAAGWTMIAAGIAVGAVFAVVALSVAVVSFPLLLDRPVGLGVAILTSVRAVRRNPVPLALWGMIVAAGLLLGSLPLLIGLVVVLPVLGHSTWHLYRAMIRS